MSSHGFIERLAELARQGVPLVSVTLVEAIGSTPQDAGSKMLVSVDGLVTGTIGGGKVEQQAIAHAVAMLAQRSPDAPANELVEWNLQRDVGMTCGGVVKFYFETYNHAVWRVAIFGAGHVAAAVVRALGQLDCQVTCIDPRAQWLDQLADSPRLKKVLAIDPRSEVAALHDDTFVVCMTMGHSTDRPILEEVFGQGRMFPYLGVIGSRAKRAVLKRELTDAGISPTVADAFHCPIGLPLGTNQPGEIAISVVAQLIQERDRWRTTTAGGSSPKSQSVE